MIKKRNFSTDSLNKEDLLDRRNIAKNLANNLVFSFPNNSESIALGITGEWGSGKSNFILFIDDELRKINKENVLHFKFNPWSFSTSQDLQTDFYIELLKFLGDNQDELRKRIKKFHKSTGGLRKLASYNPTLKLLIKGAESGIENLIKSPSYQQSKDDINYILKTKNIILIISIDDIDRLTPKEVFEVFKIVKSNYNFINTKFLLSYDKDQLLNLMKESYRSIGENYLEKIIQLEFPLPKISSAQLYNIFKKELDIFSSETNVVVNDRFLLTCWNWDRLNELFTNIREIKRFFNALRLRLNAIKDDLNPTDFIILESIRLKHFEDYKSIYEGVKSEFSYIPREKDDWEGKLVHESSRLLIRALRKQLPNSFYSKESSKHLFEKKYYSRYFTLQVKSNEIKNEVLIAFLSDTRNRSSLLKRFIKENKIEDLLIQIGNPKLDSELLEYVDIDLFSQLLKIDKTIDFDLENWITLAEAILNLLIIKKVNIDSIRDIFNPESGTNSLSFSEFLVVHYIIGQINNREGYNQSYKGEKDYDTFEVLIHLKEAFHKRKNDLVMELSNRHFTRYNFIVDTRKNKYFGFLLNEFVENHPTEYLDSIRTIEKNEIKLRHFCIFLVTQGLFSWDTSKEKIMEVKKHQKNIIAPIKDKFVPILNSIKQVEIEPIEFKQISTFLDLYNQNPNQFFD